MKSSGQNLRFVDDIFPAELAEIKKRRRKLGLREPEFLETPSIENDLIGLALSGGGIRSATFSLGVIQALVEKGRFKCIDYLSTVSGGGFIGACVCSVLNRPGADDAYFHETHGAADSPTVKHLRNSSNYLSPGGLFDRLRLPAILLRGILLNLFLLVPSLILAVFLTDILDELWHSTGAYTPSPLLIMIPFIVITYLFALIRRRFRSRFDWGKRNAFELVLAKVFALTLLVLGVITVFWVVRLCVDGWWGAKITNFFQITSLAGGIYRIHVVIVGLVLFFLIINRLPKASRVTGIILRLIVGILGPAVIFSIYLVFCMFFIESPYLRLSYADQLDMLAKGAADEVTRDRARTQIIRLLKGKGYELPAKRSKDKVNVRIMAAQQNSTSQEGETRQWDITYDDGQKAVQVVRRKGYLFIPELSTLEAIRQPGHSFGSILVELTHRIHWPFYLFGICLFLFNIFALDINITSSHGFYRDRLSEAYIFRQHDDGTLSSNDDQKMTGLNRDGTTGPYHLINTTLNLPGSVDPNLRGRHADFFTISKWYSGSEHTGYCLTEKIEYLDNHFNLGTAMAVSAAAAAPNMGAMTTKQYVFIMTLLNIRLGYWVPNPKKINAIGNLTKWKWPNVGPRHLLREAFSRLNARQAHVNLSDGGHIENLAIYQLLKRRCRLIIAVDGEADPQMAFNGLATLIRYAAIDMGISIEIDLDQIRSGGLGVSQAHWTLGTIQYGPGDDGREEIGHLLYIKSSLTGDETEYISAYRRRNPSFPHQTTADQFFDETQFECYRALGEHIALGALDDEKIQSLVDAGRPAAAA